MWFRLIFRGLTNIPLWNRFKKFLVMRRFSLPDDMKSYELCRRAQLKEGTLRNYLYEFVIGSIYEGNASASPLRRLETSFTLRATVIIGAKRHPPTHVRKYKRHAMFGSGSRVEFVFPLKRACERATWRASKMSELWHSGKKSRFPKRITIIIILNCACWRNSAEIWQK